MNGERFERRDLAIAAALALGYLVVLCSSTKSLGYMRDEGFYEYNLTL